MRTLHALNVRPSRPATLKRRLNRLLSAMLLFSVAACAASTLVVTRLVDSSRATAEEVEREEAAVHRLRHALDAEAAAAHQFIDFGSARAVEFLRQDQDTRIRFDRALGAFDSAREGATIRDARAAWDQIFAPLRPLAEGEASTAAIGEQLGDPLALHSRMVEEVAPVMDSLDALAAVPLQEVRQRLPRVKQAGQQQIWLLGGLLAVSVGCMALFGRRVQREVLHPLGEFRTAVANVGSEALGAPLEIGGSEEFGELAAAFNAMAERLEESQRHLTRQAGRTRAVIETATTAFLSIGPDGAITDWNRQARELFGWDRDEACGQNAADLLFPAWSRGASRERLTALMQRPGSAGGRPWEVVMVDRGGGEFTAEVTVWFIEEDGRWVMNGFVQDITDRKRVMELSEHMAAIVEFSDEAIVGFSPDLHVTSWNPGAERLYGYPVEAALGRSFAFLLPGDVEVNSTVLALVAQGERISGHQTRVRRHDGRLVPVSLSASPILDPQGRITGIASIAHDLTERLAVEDALRLSEQRFRALVQGSADLTLVADASGTLTYVSPASLGILGRSDVELKGCSVGDLAHAEDRARLEERCRQVVRGGGEGDVLECRVRHGDGSFRQVELTFTDLLDDAAVGGVVLNLRDITDRRRLEAELRHAQKVESVGLLASGIAHEINTPIQFVGDNVGFLQGAFADLSRVLEAWREVGTSSDPLGAAEGVRRLEAEVDTEFLHAEVPLAIDQTLDGIARVATIVRAMKAFGHPSGEEKAEADLNEAVRTTLVVANNQLKYVANVVTELGDLPPVRCHIGDMNQVILNLVVNAAHAIAEANGGNGLGTITVRTAQDGDHVVLEVADTGVGIPPEVAERIFEPFFTTKEVGVGTGQGLTLVYSLVHDRHGGSVTFNSEPGNGTTFTVRLPVDRLSARPAGGSPTAEPWAMLG